MGNEPRLVTLAVSPYCEKARWALDHAGVAYEERRHALGLHKLASRRAGGPGTVPVLVADGQRLEDSDAIVRFADERLAAHERLLPPGDEEVASLARRFDAVLGDAARRWLWSGLIDRPLVARRDWAPGVPSRERRLERAVLRAGRRSIIRELGLRPDRVAAALDSVRQTFDEVGERLADGRPFLAADRFTAADLSFAAMASPVLAPDAYRVPVPGPQDLPADMGAVMTGLREHPAGRFALRLFDERTAR